MSKSNWIVYGIAFVVSLVLLGMWVALGFNSVDMFDMVVALVWWVIIVASIITIKVITSKNKKNSSSR